MPRRPRSAPGGLVYHVLNRSVGRMKLFRTDKDFLAFQNLLVEAHGRVPIDLLSYCIMGTHWHFVVRPRADGELTAFFRWLTHTHAMRWRVAHRTVGYGHLYQGRFKSFPVQADPHLLAVCRYVERNALSAGQVERAQDWRWGSLWARERGDDALRAILSRWPVDRPSNWTSVVNRALSEKERLVLEPSLLRCRPFGDEDWIARTAKRLHMEHTIRPEGRPKRQVKDEGRKN